MTPRRMTLKKNDAKQNDNQSKMELEQNESKAK